MNDFREKLQNLSIFALREFARRSGVSSPTSKKKEILIEEIVAISEGRLQPVVDNRKGRPPKGISHEFANLINQSDRMYGNFASQQFTQNLVLNQEVEPFSYDDCLKANGYVDLSNNACVWVADKYNFKQYYISPKILNTYELRQGDMLTAEINIVQGKTLLDKIFAINSISIEEIRLRKNYENLEPVLSTSEIEFAEISNVNILKGENAFFYGSNNNENTIKVVELLKCANVDTKIYVNLSLVDKNKIYLNDMQNIEMFVSNFNAEQTYQKQVLSLAIERAKRAVEAGQNVIVVLDDLLSISYVDLQLTKDVLSLTKCVENGSVSIIAVATNGVEQFEKLADKKFNMSNIPVEL